MKRQRRLETSTKKRRQRRWKNVAEDQLHLNTARRNKSPQRRNDCDDDNDADVADASANVGGAEKSPGAVDDLLGVDVRRDAVAREDAASLPRDPEVNGSGRQWVKAATKLLQFKAQRLKNHQLSFCES